MRRGAGGSGTAAPVVRVIGVQEHCGVLWCVVRVVCVRVRTCTTAEGGALVGQHGNPAVIQSDRLARFGACGVLCVHYVPSALMH